MILLTQFSVAYTPQSPTVPEQLQALSNLGLTQGAASSQVLSGTGPFTWDGKSANINDTSAGGQTLNIAAVTDVPYGVIVISQNGITVNDIFGAVIALSAEQIAYVFSDGLSGNTGAYLIYDPNIGQQVVATVDSGSAVSLSTGTAKTVASLTIPNLPVNSVWEITGTVRFHAGSTTTGTYFMGGITSGSGNSLGSADYISARNLTFAAGALAQDEGLAVTRQLLNVTGGASASVFLCAQAGFAVSTMTAYGNLVATQIQ